MADLASRIENIINDQVKMSQTITSYRKPLVGFASAHDPLFIKMKEIIGTHHLHPCDLLPDAKTVIAFFIPFAEDIIQANRKDPAVAREWSVAYIETNTLIQTISQKIKEELEAEGISAVTQKATHNFNEEDLTALWSHKSAAYVAGLGTFGLNQMLITPSGCAGRFGSLVISAEIPSTSRPSEEYCRYNRDGKCQFCVNHCPTGALRVDGLDKQKCYAHLLAVDKQFPDLGLCDVCGKCAMGPCAFG
ncbi:epoxyqueuosine reductase [Desulfitobacterium sp. Sab5]|uniref:epoxyqueuosine reductase n=1 Tax=Desulfitobacterium nosdiversum TaxID=3375356 RepID=UPI003CF6C202